jgi:large subunit ribosomal protein L15
MPLQRRIPKSGFRSQKSLFSEEIRLSDLNKIEIETIDIAALKAHGLINANIKFVKVILAGEIKRALTLKEIGVTKGARKAIEAAGGKVEG